MWLSLACLALNNGLWTSWFMFSIRLQILTCDQILFLKLKINNAAWSSYCMWLATPPHPLVLSMHSRSCTVIVWVGRLWLGMTQTLVLYICNTLQKRWYRIRGNFCQRKISPVGVVGKKFLSVNIFTWHRTLCLDWSTYYFLEGSSCAWRNYEVWGTGEIFSQRKFPRTGYTVTHSRHTY